MVTGGRAPVRRVLYLTTVMATRRNPAIAAFYQRLLNEIVRDHRRRRRQPRRCVSEVSPGALGSS
jgi:hypothetical protein